MEDENSLSMGQRRLFLVPVGDDALSKADEIVSILDGKMQNGIWSVFHVDVEDAIVEIAHSPLSISNTILVISSGKEQSLAERISEDGLICMLNRFGFVTREMPNKLITISREAIEKQLLEIVEDRLGEAVLRFSRNTTKKHYNELLSLFIPHSWVLTENLANEKKFSSILKKNFNKTLEKVCDDVLKYMEDG